MQVRDGEVLYSATDLVGFAACEHLTQLELAVTRGEMKRPQRKDPLRDLLGRLGDTHEKNVLDDYSNGDADGSKEVVEIKTDMKTLAGLEAAAEATIAAMRAGTAVIYQATFLHDRWVGHADFLERVEQPSALGDWSYEVADAKLAAQREGVGARAAQRVLRTRDAHPGSCARTHPRPHRRQAAPHAPPRRTTPRTTGR